ncbi:hypothetical protein F2P79_011365 [Pimephales promelas]|nr:hypothetical protein F2P79_011365 [Pimephales promelas]
MCVRQQWSRKGELRFRPRLHATGQPGVSRCHSRPTSARTIANIIIKKNNIYSLPSRPSSAFVYFSIRLLCRVD